MVELDDLRSACFFFKPRGRIPKGTEMDGFKSTTGEIDLEKEDSNR